MIPVYRDERVTRQSGCLESNVTLFNHEHV
jgi:hypothetical protein